MQGALALTGLLAPPPGDWHLFLACVGSMLSTAAVGLYLAALMSSGWQTSAFGVLFMRLYAYVCAGRGACMARTCALTFACVSMSVEALLSVGKGRIIECMQGLH